MLEWTIEACLKCGSFDRVIVSTDSREYASLAEGLGAEVPFLRPKAISADTSTDLEFVVHALQQMREEGGIPSLIAHMRPTTPFRDPELIAEAVQLFKDSSGVTALRSVHPMSESAYKTFELDDSDLLRAVGSRSRQLDDANEARQTFPRTYHANGYVDILSVGTITSRGELHGDRVMAFVTPPTTEVDTQQDVDYLEFQLARDPAIAERVFGSIRPK